MIKSFRIDEVFVMKRGKETAPNRVPDGSYNMVNETSTNNGITKKAYSENVFDGNSITVSVNYATTVFYQPEPYCASVNILILENENLDAESAMYIIAMLRKNNEKYDYNNKISKNRLAETVLPFPVIENSNSDHEYTVDDIDWQYMRDRITELERDRITELDAYLQATGLNDYELTEDDKKILSLSAKRASDEDGTLEDNSEDEVRFGEFKLGQLFESQTGDVDLQRKDINDKGYFFINSGVENRGIKGKTDRPAKVFKTGTITIDFWGNAYYRDFDYVMATHNHVFSLSGDVIKNEKVGHYIIGKLSKLPQLFSYSNMATWNKLKVLDISLPIKSDAPDDYTVADIDFDYMERYIRAMEKVVIADVVKYKKKVIETTKKVVGERYGKTEDKRCRGKVIQNP